MAQAQVIAKVSSLSGEAYARDSVGQMRRLKAGDVIREGETVVAGNGAQVILQLADGREMTVQPGGTAKLDAEVAAAVKPDASDSAVVTNQSGLQKIAQALSTGGDLDALLEDPAAGVAGPGGNEGHTFIEFLRVVENVDPLSYQFGTARGAPPETLQPAAPLATDGDAAVVPTAAPVGAGSALLPDSRTLAEDTLATGNVLANDSDAGGALSVATFTVAGVAGSFTAGQTATIAGVGTLTITANGDYSFSPLADWNGTVPTVTYTTNAGSTSTLDLTVTPVNDVPTPADPGNPGFDPATGNYSVTTPEDTPVSGQVVGTDADGDVLSYTKGSDPANGTVAVNADGTWTYTPGPNYNGSDSFTVTIADDHGGVATSTVVIGVTPVNDVPTPADPGDPDFDPATGNYSVTTPEDTPVSGQVIGTDADGDALSYVKGSDPANGTVAVNADGTWTYTPGPNYNGSDSFTVTIADGHGGTATSTVFIGVTPVDDASVLAADAQIIVEDTVATGNVLANDSDVDSALTVTGFTVAGVAGSFTAGQTATIAGVGTLAIAANGDYSFAPVANWNGTVPTVSYTTNTGASSTLDITVSPLDDTPSISDDAATTPEDTAVVIRVLDNDSDADGDVLSITAIAGQPVVAGDTVAVANGTATLNADGTITFTPAANYHGTASFTYTATDGRTPVTADVTVTVTPVNDTPVAVNDSTTTPEDTPVTILVRANDSDVDGDPLAVTGFTNPANGMVTLNAQGNLVYTPNTNFNGADTFSYTISDGQGGFASATVTVNVGGTNDAPVASPDAGSTTEDLALVVGAANGVIQNDSDLDGDSLAVSGVAFGASVGAVGSALAGSWGSLTLQADGGYTYVPNTAAQGLDDGESRTDVFTYTVSDPSGLSSTTTLSLTVTGVNDGPVAIDDARTTLQDTPVIIAILGNDSDVDGEALSVTAIAGQAVFAGDTVAVANGTATLNADGTITFTPSAGYNGPADFSYTISDGTASDTANVHLVIDDVNDPPLAQDNVVNGSEDSPVNFDPRSNDSDPDGDPLTITEINGQPINPTTPVTLPQGVVSQNADGTLTFTPNLNFNGPLSFQYTIADGRGGSDTALVNLNIAPVDDASVLLADSQSIVEDTVATGNVLTNDSDVDNVLTVASFTVGGTTYAAGTSATLAGIGSLTLAANGDYSFTPVANWNGTVPTVSYTTNTGSTSALDITVTPLDDASVLAPDSQTVAEETVASGNVLANDSDVDNVLAVANFTVAGVAGSFTAGQTATIAGVGTLTIAANGDYSFTPVANWNGTVPTVNYTTNTGASSTLDITVTPVNDVPTPADPGNPDFDPATGNYSVTTPEDTPVSGQVVGTDADGDPLTYTKGSDPANGTVTVNPDGTWTYTPGPNYNGSDSFTVTIADGHGGTATSTVFIGVTPVDDASVLAADSQTIVEDTVATGNVLANDSDVDSALTVTGFTVAGVAGSFTAGQTATIAGVGTLAIAANGDYSFAPAANWNGTVPTVSYTTNTGASSTLDITVTPVDDAFTDADEVVSVTEDTTLTGSVLTGTSSVDGPVTVTGFTVAGVAGSFTAGQTATIAGVGTLTIAANGNYTFTPAANYNGPVPVATYTLIDGSSGDTSTLTITVTAVNDNPLALDDSNSVPINTATSGNVLANDSDLDGNPLTVTGFTVAGVAGSFTAGQTATIAGVGTLTIAANGDYTFTPAANYAGAIPAATYTISDGQGGSDSATLTLGMGNNAPPIAVDDGPVGVTEDTLVSGNVLVNDSDPNNNPLTVTGFTVAGVAGSFTAGQTATIAGVGTLTIAANGDYTFTPAANYNGPVPVATYSISDGLGGTDSATLSLGPVVPVNDAPVLGDTPLMLTVAEDAGNPGLMGGSPISALVGGMSDADGGALQGIAVVGSNLTHGSWYFTTDGGANWSLVGAVSPSNALLLANDANTRLYFMPDANFNGTATAALTVRAWDQTSGLSGSKVSTISNGGSTAFSSATDTIDVQVTPVNDAPIAFGIANLAPIAEDTLNPPGATVATLFGGAGNFHDNTDQVAGGSSANTFAGIAISQYSAIPAIGAWQYSTDGGASWTVLGNATPGTAITLQAADLLRFVPAADYNGEATRPRANLIESGVAITSGATVDLVGATGGTSHYSQSTVELRETVTPVDDPSVLVADSKTVAEDHPATGNVLTNDSDVDNALTVASFTVTGVAGSFTAGQTATIAGIGTLTIAANGNYTFTPVANWNGTVPTANYTTNTGGSSTLNITVTPVDDAFTDANEVVSGAEDTTLTGSVLTGTSSVDGPVTVTGFTVAGVAGIFTAGQTASIAGVGTLTIAANGDYSFIPVANYNGAVPVATYTLTDGSSGDTSTLSITVTSVDDAFTDADEVVSVAEDTTLTGSVLTGTSSVDGPVTVTGFTVAGVAGSFTAGQTASIAGVGTLLINTDGSYTFTPAANYNGAVPVATYSLTDGSSGDTSTLGITVTPVDDAFTDANEVVSVAEDTTLIGSVLTGTSSVDGPVTVTGFTVAGVAGSFTAGQTASIAGIGTLTIAANGDYSFTPAANYNGAVPVATYTLTDGSSGDTSTLSITVNPVDDAFSDANEVVSVAEDTILTGSVLTGTTSVDGPVTVTGFTVAGVAGSFTAGQTATIAGVGTLLINANGSYTFTPAANYNGAVPVATYTLTDGSSGDTSTLAITVTPVNDAPTVGNTAISVSEEGLAGGVADAVGSPGDTTNLAVRSGTIAIADIDSPLTVSLQAPAAALSAGGAAVTWSGAGSQMLIGSAGGAEVIRVTIDNSGNYQVSLSKALDHGVAGSEDTLSFNIGVTANDGANTASGVIALSVEDDSPQASSSTVSVGGTATNTNLAIVLDLSGSMDDPSGLTNVTRLAVTKEAIKELIDTYDGMGDVMVNVTVFGSSGTNGTWMTATNALLFVNAAQAFSSSGTMYTNYDAALASAMAAYGGAGKLTGSNVQNVLYFLSDGAPNRSDGNSSALLNSTPTNSASDNGIQSGEETIWTDFLNGNHISAYAIGLGTGVTTANMDPVAYDGVTGTPRDSVAVADLNDLSSVLASTIESRVTGAIMIDGGGAGGFGADGGYLAAVTYGNNAFTFNGSALTVSGAGSTTYTFDAATHVLTVTAVGGPFVVDMDTGEYTYTRLASSTIQQEAFGYTLTDRDGDLSSGTLTINLPDYDTAPVGRDDRVVVASGSVSSSPVSVTIKDAWLTWNDSDAESSTLTVSAVNNASSHTGNQVVDLVSASSGGSGSFTYTVSDGGQTNEAAVSITTINSSTLDGTGLDNILVGDNSGETIRGYEGNDVLVGNAGTDTLDGGSGNDLLIGGTGNDSLTGGIGSDTFAWSLADQGTAATPARDAITDFSTAAKAAGGDVLDLRDLLQGESHVTGTGNLGDFLHFTKSGSDTVIDIKPTGAAGSLTQQIVMTGVDLTANNTLNDQAIIQDLLTKGKLVTD